MNILITSGLLAIGLLVWGAIIVWRWHSTYTLSKQVYVTRQKEGDLLPEVREEEFIAAFMHSEGPRAVTYIYVCALLSTFLVPIGMMVFSYLWQLIWEFTGEPEVFRRGTMVHIFAMVLAGMVAMILILLIGMRRFHGMTSVNLNKAIRLLNERVRQKGVSSKS